MKQERMKVLELLESGKITAEEATRLLETIKRPEHGGFAFDDDTKEQFEEKVNRFTKNVDGFARDFGSKVENAYREFEPKLKKASQVVLEKTASIFDDISKSLNESLEQARKNAESGDCCGGGDGNREN